MIRVFFGSPGCGKTTFACCRFAKEQKLKRPNYDYFYSNFDNDLSIRIPSLQGLGSWTFPEHSYIIIDEAGIEYNSRKYKTLDQMTIQWFKLHRHYKCDVDFISQSWEDMDITIRRLADELWYIKKFGPISIVRRVYKSVKVDDKTHQIIDAYQFGKLLKRLLPWPLGAKTWFIIWRPKYYKYFNTYEKPNTPVRYFIPELDQAATLSANPGDGAIPAPGAGSDPAESDHVGAGSPGALARRRIASMLSHILKYMQRLKNKLTSRTK